MSEVDAETFRRAIAGYSDIASSLSTSADQRLAQFDEEFGPPPMSESASAEEAAAPMGEDVDVPADADVQLASLSFSDPGAETDAPLVLTVMDAINAAAHSNPHLRVLSYVPLEAETQTQVEQAQFDTTLSAGTQLLNANQQVTSAVQANAAGRPEFSSTAIGPASNLPNLFQLEKRFTSGTVARLGAGTSYNASSPAGQFLVYNPAYQSGVTAVIEQRLFRGFGSKINLSGARIAVMGHQKSQAEFQAELNRTLNEVQQTYWLAWLAQSESATYETLVDEAQVTLNIEQTRLQLGEGGLVETAQAKENLAALKVEREQARQRQLTAKNRLKAAMGLATRDLRDVELIEQPFEDEVIPDLQSGLETAVQSRPELKAQQLAVRQAQLDLDRIRNHARPDLVAYAGYGLTGLNDGAFGSLTNLTSAQYGNATLGVRFQHVFGRRAELAAVERAEYALRRQSLNVHEAVREIEQHVKEAHDAILTTWRVLQRQRERAEASQMQYDTYDQLYKAGQLDLDRLIRSRTLLANALQEREAALVDYNLALAHWNYSMGMTANALAIEPDSEP